MLLALAGWMLCSFIFAQFQPFRQLNPAEGYPFNGINSFYRDDSGILWVGSQTGLFSYEGRNFTKHPFGFPDSVRASPYIYHVSGSKRGFLLIGTRTGVMTYDPLCRTFRMMDAGERTFSESSFTNIPGNDDAFLVNSGDGLALVSLGEQGNLFPVKRIAAGPVYRSFAEGMLSCNYLLGRKIVRYDGLSGAFSTVFGEAPVVDYHYDPTRNTYIIATENGIFYGKPGDFRLFTISGVEWKDLFIFQPLNVSDDGRIYLSFTLGLLCIENLEDGSFHWYRHDDLNPSSLGISQINTSYADRFGTLWVGGSTDGISYQTAEMAKMLCLPKSVMQGKNTWSLLPAGNGMLWAGTDDGAYILHTADAEKTLREEFRRGDGRFAVSSLLPLDDGSVLAISRLKGLMLLKRGAGRPSEIPLAPGFPGFYSGYHLYRLSDGRVLFTGFKTGILDAQLSSVTDYTAAIAKISNGSTLPSSIYAVEETADGIFFGGGGGVVQTTEEKGVIRSFMGNDSSGKTSWPMTVLWLEKYGEKELLAGTMGGGLWKIVPASGKSVPLQLPGNPENIYTIMPLQGNLYLTTSSGFYCLDSMLGFRWKADLSSLLPFNDFNQFAGYTDTAAGTIFTAGEKGIVIFEDPGSFRFPVRNPIIVRQRKNGDEAGNTHLANDLVPLVLQPSERSLQLDVHTLRWDLQSKIPMEYMIEGLDRQWNRMQSDRIFYPVLPAGNYRLMIRTIENPGLVAPAAIEISIHAKPFFYETLLFRIALAALALAALYFIIRFITQYRLRKKLERLEAERRLVEERIRISRELHDNLGSQLTYLSMGLESSGMMIGQDAHEAEVQKLLSEMKTAARDSIQDLRNSIWALNREMLSLENIIERFSGWAKTFMAVRPEMQFIFHMTGNPAVQVDPLVALNIFRILQEALQNSIKYAKADTISLDVLVTEDGTLLITIADNGTGMNTDAAKNGNGLRNIRRRAADIGASLRLTSSEGNGTAIGLEIGIKKQA